MLRFEVPGKRPGLNELIDARMKTVAVKGSKRTTVYTRMKKEETDLFALCARAANGKARRGSAHAMVLIDIYEPNKRRDPDNVQGAVRKFALDGLVKAGVLQNDGWRDVHPTQLTRVGVDELNPRTVVRVCWPQDDLYKYLERVLEDL